MSVVQQHAWISTTAMYTIIDHVPDLIQHSIPSLETQVNNTTFYLFQRDPISFSLAQQVI